jgi:hypothetical protein
LAIALNEKFGMDQFLFVENKVEPDRLYHVASVKNRKIYDVDGITNINQIKQRGFDDDYPNSRPTVEKFPASKDLYRFILKGTDPTIEINDLLENFADGKNPGRKGLSRRVGIPKKATLGKLEKIARSSTGERRRMAQWQLNMRRGKKK